MELQDSQVHDRPPIVVQYFVCRPLLLDPIYWQQAIKVTIQQIGHNPKQATTIEQYKQELYERSDDWCVTSFWYEACPSARLPGLLDYQERVCDLPEVGVWP